MKTTKKAWRPRTPRPARFTGTIHDLSRILVPNPGMGKGSWSGGTYGNYAWFECPDAKNHWFGVGGWDETTTGRLVHEGPMVPGPHMYLFGMPMVIDNHGGSGADIQRAKAAGRHFVVRVGDRLVWKRKGRRAVYWAVEAIPFDDYNVHLRRLRAR